MTPIINHVDSVTTEEARERVGEVQEESNKRGTFWKEAQSPRENRDRDFSGVPMGTYDIV